MPIVFVHGVNVRDAAPSELTAESQLHEDSDSWSKLHLNLTTYIAPIISAEPAQVLIRRAYWGDLGASFRFAGASRPPSPLLAAGGDGGGLSRADRAIALSSLANPHVWPGEV